MNSKDDRAGGPSARKEEEANSWLVSLLSLEFVLKSVTYPLVVGGGGEQQQQLAKFNEQTLSLFAE